MDDLLTIPRPALRSRRPELLPAVLVAVLLAVVFVLVALAVRPPDTVDLTVVNDQEWRAEVSVRPSDEQAWTGVGSVDRNGSVEFLTFPDQGGEWVVRFSYAGLSEEITVSRQSMVDDGWSISVPEELARQLREAGVPPTAG